MYIHCKRVLIDVRWGCALLHASAIGKHHKNNQ